MGGHGAGRTRASVGMALALCTGLAACAHEVPANTLPRVQFDTTAGKIVIEVDTVHAPLSANNFLALVDLNGYAGGSFYRVVRPDNDTQPLKISVVQGGVGDAKRDPALPPLPGPVAHETTTQSGLRNVDGAVSLARGKPGTGGSEFFINVGDNPVLDTGGQRNPDGQGFAVFGRVVQGMDVVRRIQHMPSAAATQDSYVKGQMLDAPVRIERATRLR